MQNRKGRYRTALMLLISSITLISVILPMMLESKKTCTIFTITKGEQIYFGNNEDWHTDDLILGFFPSEDVHYGAVHFGYYDSNGTAQFQGAVNEAGLAWDVNSLPKSETNPHPEKPFDYFSDRILSRITREAATVEDVRGILEQVDFGESMTYQVHFADSTGDAIIVSNGQNGEITFTALDPDTGFMVSTNFNQARDDNGKPGWRYETAVKMLSGLDPDEINFDSLGKVLDAVHLNMLTTYTLYSDIIDLSNLKIRLYYMSQFDEYAEIDILEGLSEGQHIVRMRDLFSEETLAKGEQAYRRFELKFKAAIIAVVLLSLLIVFGLITFVVKRTKNRTLRDS